MDPYNDPNRQSYPPQNYQQQPQAYYPPNQYPQLTYPNAQNTSCNVNTTNAIQYVPYAQQHIIELPNDGLRALDHGWFQFYKILLYIYLALLILGSIGLINALIEGGYGRFIFLFGFDMTIALSRLVLVIVQLQAMQGRDPVKAKIALTGFLIYLALDPIYIFGVTYLMYGYLLPVYVARNMIGFGVFIVLVLIGSIQVYRFLKKNLKPNDGYQNVTNTV